MPAAPSLPAYSPPTPQCSLHPLAELSRFLASQPPPFPTSDLPFPSPWPEELGTSSMNPETSPYPALPGLRDQLAEASRATSPHTELPWGCGRESGGDLTTPSPGSRLCKAPVAHLA